MQNSNQSSAYDPSVGLEDGDIIDMEYEGKFVNDTVFDAQRIPRTDVSKEFWITGFYEGLLGMQPKIPKTFEIPPQKGYTDPDHELYGEILIFTVFIHEVLENVRDFEPTEERTSSSFLTSLINVVGFLVAAGFIGFVVIGLILPIFQKQTSANCIHCKSLGRSALSEGICGHCGNEYCRASFSKGCPNCKSNKVIPHKKSVD